MHIEGFNILLGLSWFNVVQGHYYVEARFYTINFHGHKIRIHPTEPKAPKTIISKAKEAPEESKPIEIQETSLSDPSTLVVSPSN